MKGPSDLENQPYKIHTAEELYDMSFQTYGQQEGWPPNVAILTTEASDHLGFDRNGNLYFVGKRLEIAKKFDLTIEQTWLARITALGVLLAGMAAVSELFLSL